MLIKVKVKPNSKKNEIIPLKENSFLVKVLADAKNNQANQAVLELLKKYFNIDDIFIKKGHKSRNKLIFIPDGFDQINRAVEVLNNGGVIIYPTDTIFGIGCDIYNTKAIEKLIKIKKRNNNPMTIAVSDIDMMKTIAYVENEDIIKDLLPGPFTFIFKKRNVSDLITNLDTVGVRIPDNQTCLEIIKRFGGPIISTSANLVNKPFPKSLKDIEIRADFVVQGKCKHNLGSTIVDLKNKKILRQGAGKICLK